LVRRTRDYDRGRIGEDALNAAFEIDAEDFINLQKNEGISFVSDGQLRWQDFIRPFSESVQGLESGADLSRWYDTNTFYKKPKVTKNLTTDGSFITLKKYSENRSNGGGIRRSITIPGPFTLSSLVEDQFYGSREELVHAFAKILKKVIDHLSNSGYSRVQINEPSLVYRYGDSALNNPKALEITSSVFREELEKLPLSEITLHTYFGDCSKILPVLLGFPSISSIGIDFTQTSIDKVASIDFDGKGLGVGCVDARSSLVESPEWISDFSKHASRLLMPARLLLLPSSDLKYLPRKYADRKLEAIGKAVKILRKMGPISQEK
jgi:methionine synthase II (cobalamin-independent)